MKCPFCSSSSTEAIIVNHTFFRHSDFESMKESSHIGRCSACQIIFNDVNEGDITEIENLLRSEAYSLSKQTDHTLFVEDYRREVTRSFLQAELLSEIIEGKQQSVLDIGCFDGELLTEFDRRFESSELHGFDINHNLRSIFPQKSNMHFWSSDLGDLEDSFDLICMSHSIQYIRDLSNLMKHMKRLIKNDGLIFIQAPDISKNPYSILFGDQYYYYTPEILVNIFHSHGFEFSLVNNNWFPREIVGIAKLANQSDETGYIEDLNIYGCIQYLEDMVNRLKNLSTNSRVGVLGTTVNASFVDSVLGEKLAFFADENYYRSKPKFRNKKVLHPRSLDDSDLLVIPYGKSSRAIEERYKSQYKGQFVSM